MRFEEKTSNERRPTMSEKERKEFEEFLKTANKKTREIMLAAIGVRAGTASATSRQGRR